MEMDENNSDNNIDSRDMLSLIKKLNYTIDELHAKTSSPIAIIGMSCRFPGGANNLDEYWRVLSEGIDTITEIPKSRFNVDDYYDADPDAPEKMYPRGGAFLDNVTDFDAQFFGIAPREAQALDPQQRILHE